VLDKLDEELRELAEARENGTPAELEGEIGDLLFVLVNLARFFKVDPEQALRKPTRNSASASLSSKPRRFARRHARTKWRRCGSRPRRGNDRNSPAHRPRRSEVRRPLAAPNLGFRRCRLIPLRLFVVATKIGGQVYGAFDGAQHGRLLHAIPGLKPGGKPICTATCWACCRNTAMPASAAS
jgi:hypothetical protein